MQDAFCGRQCPLVGTLVNVELSKDRQRTIQKRTFQKMSQEIFL